MRCKVIFFILSIFIVNFSYAQEENFNFLKSIEPPLYGIVMAGSNLVIDINSYDFSNRKNLASYIKPQTPILITAEHTNLPFYFVETETVKGWIYRGKIKIVGPEDFDRLFMTDKIILTKSININDTVYPIATRLPLLRETKKFYITLIATNEGFMEYKIEKKLATKPLLPTINNAKKITRIFLKKPYVWANDDKGWDCSGLIQDLYSFFNIVIPRNSFDQINFTDHIDVSNSEPYEKEKILKKAKPYFTLLYFPGHIMIYTGKKGKEFMSFQALSKIGDKKYGYIGYFPLKKTGFLKKITKIGFIDKKLYSQLTLSMNHLNIKEEKEGL